MPTYGAAFDATNCPTSAIPEVKANVSTNHSKSFTTTCGAAVRATVQTACSFANIQTNRGADAQAIPSAFATTLYPAASTSILSTAPTTLYATPEVSDSAAIKQSFSQTSEVSIIATYSSP